MEIDERYFKLLNLLIYDKRSNTYGMISGIIINNYFNVTMISYQVFVSRVYAYSSLFIEDIEKGNVVFLLPFSTKYKVIELEEMAKRHEERIKEFFGNKFREDMIIRISEEKRQEEIRKWDDLSIGFENWEKIDFSKL